MNVESSFLVSVSNTIRGDTVPDQSENLNMSQRNMFNQDELREISAGDSFQRSNSYEMQQSENMALENPDLSNYVSSGQGLPVHKQKLIEPTFDGEGVTTRSPESKRFQTFVKESLGEYAPALCKRDSRRAVLRGY